MGSWDLIEADLHQVYGIDAGDLHLMRHRPWRWLRARILGLLSTPTRTAYRLYPPAKE